MESADLTLSNLKILLTHRGTCRSGGVLYPVHTRLTAENYGLLEAMTRTATSGTSRNMMVNQLLALAIQITMDALPTDLADSLNHLKGQIIATRVYPDRLPADEQLANDLPAEEGEL